MNIHITPMGRNTGHIYTAMKEFRIDRLVLITGKEFLNTARDMESHLSPFDIITVITTINPFQSDSYSKIVDHIISEYLHHQKDNIFVNITGGTNLMSSAALTAAQFIGASAYYVVKNGEGSSIINVPIIKISLKDTLTSKQQLIFQNIQDEIKKAGKIENISAFAEKYGSYKQKVVFHLASLENMNIIKIDRSKREHSLSLTETGILVGKLL